MKISIIGAGNMGGAIALGLAKGSIFKGSEITCSDKSEKVLQGIKEVSADIILKNNNKEAVKEADIVVLAIKPWLIESVIEEIRDVLDFEKQIIVSIVAGVTFTQLESFLTQGIENLHPTIFRVIPNTAIEVLSSMTFVAAQNASKEQTDLIVNIFNELGNAILVEERLMSAGTALGSCGIAFAFRYIRAAIEGGVELGFYPHEAQQIVTQTIKGAVDLLMAKETNPESEIDKVTTPGGITIKGLNEMEHSGFTSSVIKGLKAASGK